MNKELLKAEILIQCQNVQCGAKLAAEIHYCLKPDSNEDILEFSETMNHFPDLKYFINYHPDFKAMREGHKSLYIYKYEGVEKLINEINSIENKNSALYHFASGKLFGYNDYEVMKFIEKENL